MYNPTKDFSPEHLEKYLKITPEHAKQLSKMLNMKIYVTEYFEVDHVIGVLNEANEMMDECGVETLNDERAWINHYYENIIALYVNTGETYTGTVLYDTGNGEFLLTSWGDFYEGWENELECCGEEE